MVTDVAQRFLTMLSVRPREIHDDEMGRALHDIFRAAHTQWPSTWINAPRFERHIAERIGAEEEHALVVEQLKSLHAADLYLACACSEGNPDATRAFAETYFDDISLIKRRFPNVSSGADDIRQDLSIKLFVAPAPKVLQYSGKGELRGWFRAVVVRTMLDLSSAPSAREVSTSCDFFECTLDASSGGPEDRLVRETYRTELRAALGTAFERLSHREKNMLRYVFVEHLTLNQIAAIYGMHRATIARWLEAAQSVLAHYLREALAAKLGVSDTQFESILRAAMSGIEITLERHLARA